MVRRALEDVICSHLFRGKAIIILGARQVGKTTLVGKLLENIRDRCLFLNADEGDVRELLQHPGSGRLEPYLGSRRVLFIDEAQRMRDAGLTLKIIHDQYPGLQLIATGSSAMDLDSKIREPMTGRKYEFFLHPLSFAEMVEHHGLYQEKALLEQRLVYGYYPDIVTHAGEAGKLLKALIDSFLYKDLLMLELVKKPVLLEKILRAPALQTGSEVSYNELANMLQADKGTIEKYIDLLEKAYLVFRLPALSRNLRNELKKSRKIYFFDNGIRNAILANFHPVARRTDTGAFWENFLVSERYKYLSDTGAGFNAYFWRTTQQQEIDYVEETEKGMAAFEFKWRRVPGKVFSKTFTGAYPEAVCKVISTENYHEFLSG